MGNTTKRVERAGGEKKPCKMRKNHFKFWVEANFIESWRLKKMARTIESNLWPSTAFEKDILTIIALQNQIIQLITLKSAVYADKDQQKNPIIN